MMSPLLPCRVSVRQSRKVTNNRGASHAAKGLPEGTKENTCPLTIFVVICSTKILSHTIGGFHLGLDIDDKVNWIPFSITIIIFSMELNQA